MASHSTSASDAYPQIYGPIPAGRTARGRLTPPGSKSLTQRYFALALLTRQGLEIHRPLLSDDIRFFLDALKAANFRVEESRDLLRVTPVGELDDTPRDVFCGAGGTMMRFLTAALTAIPGQWRLDGIERLRERPVGPLVEALRGAGATVRSEVTEGFPPLHLAGRSLRGGHTRLDAGASSQFLSAMLMAGMVTPEPLTVEVEALTSEPYVDLTVDAIRELGGDVERDGDLWTVHPRSGVAPESVRVEADFSAAAYPAAAAALTGGKVRLDGLRSTSRQGDRAFISRLEEMGARVQWSDDALDIQGAGLRAIDADLEATPDQVPTLAALAPFAEGTTRIRNVPHLRLKESDRLAAMTQELRRAGAEVEELEDGLIIPGVWADEAPPETPVRCLSHGDHRIAMSMALVGLRRPRLEIDQPSVVSKSYPDFWRDFESLTGAP
ncbi:MAG: 3-phosphoshikimate 1-carboxyvinyltransferase [Acidobacteriota bacterium]